MDLKCQETIESITTIARRHKGCPGLLALVGSSSPLSQEVIGDHFDIDLLIIDDGDLKPELILDLTHSISQECKILNTWSIVSAAAVGAPVVHMHRTETTAYATYSSLFRRSVAKYPSLIGAKLAAYAPRLPISRVELLEDGLGINSLYRKISTSLALSDHPQTDRTNDFASLIDISLYCALHSIRNTLRWLGIYDEFSPTDRLAESWTKVCGPKPDSLQRFISEKRERRQGRYFTREEEHSSARECRSFLAGLSKWVSTITYRQ
jgi:hypothetical protein